MDITRRKLFLVTIGTIKNGPLVVMPAMNGLKLMICLKGTASSPPTLPSPPPPI